MLQLQQQQQRTITTRVSNTNNKKQLSMRRLMNVFKRNKKHNDSAAQEEQHRKFSTIGGVFVVTTDEHDDDDNFPTVVGLKRHDSSTSLNTVDTRTSDQSGASASHHSDDSNSTNGSCWSSSGSDAHHQGAPLLTRSNSNEGDGGILLLNQLLNPHNIELSDEELMGRIMIRSRKLPRNNGYMIGNHVMINNERTKRLVIPLVRDPSMDELARTHARHMAQQGALSHSDAEQLQDQLLQSPSAPSGRQTSGRPDRRIGENVTRGPNLQSIHKSMMKSIADRNNIIDRRFTSMGVGTAKSEDGTLYLCQLFRD